MYHLCFLLPTVIRWRNVPLSLDLFIYVNLGWLYYFLWKEIFLAFKKSVVDKKGKKNIHPSFSSRLWYQALWERIKWSRSLPLHSSFWNCIKKLKVCCIWRNNITWNSCTLIFRLIKTDKDIREWSLTQSRKNDPSDSNIISWKYVKSGSEWDWGSFIIMPSQIFKTIKYFKKLK